jgi:hypothetical protein
MKKVFRTVLMVAGIQLAITGSAVAVAFHEHHGQQQVGQEAVECGTPALVATVVGYSLWKTRDCGAGKSEVYMITPPAVIENVPPVDRSRST